MRKLSYQRGDFCLELCVAVLRARSGKFEDLG